MIYKYSITIIISALHLCNGWVVSPVGMTTTTTTTTTRLNSVSSSVEASTTVVDKEILGKGDKIWHEHCTEPTDRDILIRSASGERTERTPVWLMRQAGRYMEAFREYSDKLPFRERSETPDIAIELSLQCHRAYGMDGIIMFSDILTPLPCLGIDFDVIKGSGPVITTKIRTENDVNSLPNYTFDDKVPFIKTILNNLSNEAKEANTALIGFVGAPFTLAAYTVEQKSSKHCLDIKKMLLDDEAGTSKAATIFLNKLANLIGNYACYQIDNGAEIIQIFESWAHQLTPKDFELYAKPAALQAIEIIKTKHPNVPVIYFANGGSSYLEKQKDMVGGPLKANMLAIDWAINMKTAREILGPDIPISGNIDPIILRLGNQKQIEQAVRDCIDDAGGPGNKHLLNLGHGVMQGTPEIAIKWFVDEVKRYNGKN